MFPASMSLLNVTAECLYVGQSCNLRRRVYEEICMAHIGGSEEVVRFLMFLLDRVCRGGYESLDAKGREKLVKELLMDF